MVLSKGKDIRLEKRNFQLKKMNLATQVNKGSQRKEVTLEEEMLIKEVEEEEGADRLSIDVTNVTKLVIGHLSVRKMKLRGKAVIM